ncbi:hypothetical protein [Cardiobacterium hominis]|jgi:hypothetical protein|uniref:hypothetical protein n=1 Tax=Cardiobacterium hominis TaxID=2718 RepID=UPI0024908EA7|nr:hypothetical protein [Cardiobacterium hominis]
MTENSPAVTRGGRYNRHRYELKGKENLMNWKMWFAALALLCVQNALTIKLPQSWQNGMGEERGGTHDIPQDIDERGVIL